MKHIVGLGVLLCLQISAFCAETSRSLRFKDQTLELLVGKAENVTLELSPSSEETVQVSLYCYDDDCDVFKFVEGNVFEFTKNVSRIDVALEGVKPGKRQLVVNATYLETKNDTIDISHAFVNVNVGRSGALLLISQIVGWIYFFSWGVSFYPQIYEMWRNRSAEGYSIDYASLNITGYLCYFTFNVALFYIRPIQRQFESENARRLIPVQLNDVLYAAHGILCCTVLLLQLAVYPNGGQRLSWFSRVFLLVVWGGIAVLGGVVAFSDLLKALTLVYICSYVKLAVTLVKYVPQGYYNYRRKSTVGWNITTIFLDIIGGTLSMGQMFLLAHNYDDWPTIFKNFSKFGLGLLTILFDVFFILQHYVFYPQKH